MKEPGVKTIGVFLGSEPHDGGIFQYGLAMLEAAAALPRERFSVVAACASDRWVEESSAFDVEPLRLHVGGGAVLVGRAWRAAGLPMSLWRRINPWFHPLSRALRRAACDLWIFPSQDRWSYQIAVPTLGVVHDLMHRYERRFPEIGHPLEVRRRDYHYAQTCRWAKGVLVDSAVGKTQLCESYRVDPDDVHVLPFIAPKYMHAPGPPPGFEERYRLPERFIFYPAQFWEHKNHKGLIRAVHHLRDQLPDLKLVLVGSKKNGFGSTARLVQELDLEAMVTFLGYVPEADMPELYRRARAMVMPTFCGPTNIPPLEAFATGCPVALSGVYGMPEQVGDSALLFDPNSLASMAGAIHQLWTDDRLARELAEKGRLHAQRWNQAHFNQRLREILERVLEMAPSPQRLDPPRAPTYT